LGLVYVLLIDAGATDEVNGPTSTDGMYSLGYSWSASPFVCPAQWCFIPTLFEIIWYQPMFLRVALVFAHKIIVCLVAIPLALDVGF